MTETLTPAPARRMSRPAHAALLVAVAVVAAVTCFSFFNSAVQTSPERKAEIRACVAYNVDHPTNTVKCVR